MKNKQIFTLLILIMTSCKSCDKNNDATPSGQLPAATQEGKNTFGCLIDGKVFVPKGGIFSGPILTGAYQYVDGVFYFQVAANNTTKSILTAITINTFNARPKSGSVVALGKWIEGAGEGLFFNDTNHRGLNRFSTDSVFLGELTFSRFDTVKLIASGTFWFDVFDSTSNAKIQIREGRFDVPFTR